MCAQRMSTDASFASSITPLWTRHIDHMARLHVPAADGDAIAMSRTRHSMYPIKRKTSPQSQACTAAPPTIERAAREHRATCADLRAGRTSALKGVRPVIGITSSPELYGQHRRDGIRSTWLRYPAIGSSAVACFVVGRQGLKPRQLKRLEQENAQHDDIIWLKDVLDGKGPFVTISKLHSWFRLVTQKLGLLPRRAARTATRDHGNTIDPVEVALEVKHIAKVDDDTFLQLPELHADLDSLHCHAHLYYGAFAFAGYNPITFLKCGFEYSGSGARYRKYGCAKVSAEGGGAAHPPFPFTSGALMLASTPLIVRIASEPAVSAFVTRSTSSHHTDEDVAMGFWFSRFHLGGIQPPLAYMNVNQRLMNLGCYPRKMFRLYSAPRNRSVGVHFLKSAGAQKYVWGVLHDGLRHNASRCREMTGDGRL